MGMSASCSDGGKCAASGQMPVDVEDVEANARHAEKASVSNSSSTSSPSSSGENQSTDVSASPSTKLQVLHVDEEAVRAIPLHVSLQGFGWLWRTSPVDMDPTLRSQLWSLSKPSEGFNVFLSHTWNSPGKWKYLSLLLYSSWPVVLIVWALVVLTTFLLCLFDALPMTFEYHGTQTGLPVLSGGPWIMLAGSLATVVSLLIAPYIPRIRPTRCFLDAVSINQTDPQLMEQGIYGLGGFLRLSEELRVMWTPAHFTRLWCVFELAAFRHANPTGKVTLAPVFVEGVAVCLLLSFATASALLWVSMVADMFVDIKIVWPLIASPAVAAIHMARKILHNNKKLLHDLETFDAEAAGCRMEFDREYIHEAISSWYGSLGAFTEYVRGPLRKELLGSAGRFRLPLPYLLIVLTAGLNTSLEELLSLCKAGAWANAVSHFLAHTVGLTLSAALSMRLMIYLSDRFAAPGPSLTMDMLRSVNIFLVFNLVSGFGAGMSVVTVREGPWTAGAWACAMIAISALSFEGVERLACPEPKDGKQSEAHSAC
mmetsp:Transcript_60135/g.140544  ORF Transcript_60135/g.140544 Transcript_60135/m.140544 type:complete len:541 (+) Transcript_60135:62-1684(+)